MSSDIDFYVCVYVYIFVSTEASSLVWRGINAVARGAVASEARSRSRSRGPDPVMERIEGWDSAALRVMLHNIAYIVQHRPQRRIPSPVRDT